MAEKVEGAALGGEQRPEGARDPGDHAARRHLLAVVEHDLAGERRVDLVADLEHAARPGDDAGMARHEGGPCGRVGRQQRRRQVAERQQVLREGERDRGADRHDRRMDVVPPHRRPASAASS